MNRAQREAFMASQRKSRHTRRAEPAVEIVTEGLVTVRLSPTRLRLEWRADKQVQQSWIARSVLVDKQRLWLINDGTVTLAAVWRACWPTVPPNLTWLQEELDRSVA